MPSPSLPLRSLFLISLFQGFPFAPGHLRGQVQEPAASTVRGQVFQHESRGSLWGAAVSLASGPDGTRGIGTRVTGEDGRFLFRAVPPGLYRLTVTLLGYTALRDTLRVAPGAELDLLLPLSAEPIPLEPIVVEARRREPSYRAGFERRRRTMGGTFITREEIEERNPQVFTDLLRMVPGARVVPVSSFGRGVLFRGQCVPELYVDGMRLASTLDLDAVIQPMDVEAMEVYTGAHLPAEFGPTPCGAIVVWTRVGEPVDHGGSFWRRLLVVAGVVSLILILNR
jgi:hypothetical protein